MTPPRPDSVDDPFAVLGLHPDADHGDVVEARRRLAKDAHPDAGGTVTAMQRINAAAERAIASIRASPRSNRAGRGSGVRGRGTSGGAPTPTHHDHPSFTIEALPAVAFEALLLVAAHLGSPLADDPPYCLEVALMAHEGAWCRLDVVPDAGASTVSLSVAAEPGRPVPDIDDVRDAWIDGLNRLDWSRPGEPHLPPPW